ncbi:MAG: hypothetical protein CML06_21035 [Pseudomonadales bacterium]|nr:hypothetical protein [Pseudomonadales bacterium]
MNIAELIELGSEAQMMDLSNAMRGLDQELVELHERIKSLDQKRDAAAMDPDNESAIREFVVEVETVKALLASKRKQKELLESAMKTKLRKLKMQEFDFKWNRDCIERMEDANEKLFLLVKKIEQAAKLFHQIRDARRLAVQSMPISPKAKRASNPTLEPIGSGANLTLATAQMFCDLVGAGSFSVSAREIWNYPARHNVSLAELFGRDVNELKTMRELYPYGDPDHPESV